MVGAGHSPCGFTSGLNSRQKKRDQYSDDRNHYKKFDEGKTVSST
jgi:hypothetical protein